MEGKEVFFLKKIKGANPIQEGSILMTPKASPPYTITMRLGFQPVNFVGTQTFSL